MLIFQPVCRIEFVQKLKYMNSHKRSELTRQILIGTACFVGPTILTIAMLQNSGIASSAMHYVYMFFLGIVVLGLVIWSSWNVITISRMMKTENDTLHPDAKALLQKNTLLGVCVFPIELCNSKKFRYLIFSC